MLNISIVLYRPNWQQIIALTNSLLNYPDVHRIYWVDNSATETTDVPSLSQKVCYIYNGKNLGYGAAHNIAIRASIRDNIAYHLVINPDIVITNQTLPVLIDFLMTHLDVGCVTPKVVYPNGQLQYLCKLLPTPLDVFGRRFLPKRWMIRRNHRYELHQSGYNRVMNIPYLSGCFMLLRTEAVKQAQLFDEQFFMYPEDVDLTRRIHRNYQTIYYPHTTIIHNHEQASYHTWRMLWIHAVNMCKYFNKWGWWFDAERRQVNRQTIQECLTTPR